MNGHIWVMLTCNDAETRKFVTFVCEKADIKLLGRFGHNVNVQIDLHKFELLRSALYEMKGGRYSAGNWENCYASLMKRTIDWRKKNGRTRHRNRAHDFGPKIVAEYKAMTDAMGSAVVAKIEKKNFDQLPFVFVTIDFSKKIISDLFCVAFPIRLGPNNTLNSRQGFSFHGFARLRAVFRAAAESQHTTEAEKTDIVAELDSMMEQAKPWRSEHGIRRLDLTRSIDTVQIHHNVNEFLAARHKTEPAKTICEVRESLDWIVHVQFFNDNDYNGKSYGYLSPKPIPCGHYVVVSVPNQGMKVVRVHSCELRSNSKISFTKRIVGEIDVEDYRAWSKRTWEKWKLLRELRAKLEEETEKALAEAKALVIESSAVIQSLQSQIQSLGG
jgi:hypothetical protein